MKTRIKAVLLLISSLVFLCSAVTVFRIKRQYREEAELYREAAASFTRPSQAMQTGPVTEQGPAHPAQTTEKTEATGETEKTEKTEESRVLVLPPIEVDFEELLRLNPDVQGWIYCPDTVINYPVLRGETNDDYLHRDYLGNYSASGSIFMDADNRSGFVDLNSIVYGHHMDNGTMFAALEQWENQSFYEEHPVMWLLTPERDYRIELLSGFYTSAYSGLYRVCATKDDAWEQYLDEVLAQSLFQPAVPVDRDAHFVLLSTCAYIFDNARSVLFGQLVPLDTAGGRPIES